MPQGLKQRLLLTPRNDARLEQAMHKATGVPDLFLSIEPSKVLKWVPCSPPNRTDVPDVPLRYECAKLMVSVFPSPGICE